MGGFDLKKITFVGLENFKLIPPDWIFWKAMRNTFYFVVGTTVFLKTCSGWGWRCS